MSTVPKYAVTVHAFTPSGSDFPPYVNLEYTAERNYRLTVRSPGDGGKNVGCIRMSAADLRALIEAATADLLQREAKPAVSTVGFMSTLPPHRPLDLNDDTPLAPACDLSGDGSCEACQ